MRLFAKARPANRVASDLAAWRPHSTVVRVLLIDDDEDEAMLLRGNLDAIAGSDFKLDWASTYSDGLSALERDRYDLCLVDYQLGAMDGVELVREARARGWRKPMIMLTGQRDRSIDLAAMEAGATDFLVKGQTDPVLLERSLRYAVSLGDATEALRRSYEQLAALDEIGKVLAEEGPTPEALDRAVELVVEAFGHPRASMYLVDGDRLTLAAQRGYRHVAETLDPASARLARVLHARRPTLIPNHTVAADQRSANDPMELCVPLNAADQVFGILNVAVDSRHLGQTEQRGILAIADRVAVALALNRALRSRSADLAHHAGARGERA